MLDIYTTEEKRAAQEIADHFSSEILQLSKNCFYYRGLLLPINHFESCVFWDACGIGHLEHPERLSNNDIIDAGAFIGDSALIFSSLTKWKVYAFEPISSNYELMLKTIDMNRKTNIVPCLFALGEASGTIDILVRGSSSTQFGNPHVTYNAVEKAEVTTLDSYVQEHGLKVGLIKADVEGANNRF